MDKYVEKLLDKKWNLQLKFKNIDENDLKWFGINKEFKEDFLVVCEKNNLDNIKDGLKTITSTVDIAKIEEHTLITDCKRSFEEHTVKSENYETYLYVFIEDNNTYTYGFSFI